jgi:heterodisulfide reductase subunit C
MASKPKQALLLLIYYLSPIAASIIYWFSSNDLGLNLIQRAGSILGIFAFIWMCFNILIAIRFKIIEENFSLEGIIKFHTRMASIALFLSVIHYPMSRVGRELIGDLNPLLMRTGPIGFMVFFTLMVLAIIFMTNLFINRNKIVNMRAFFYKKKFRYNVNKVLHNLTLLGVIVIFVHSFFSITSESSTLMRIVYFIFTIITLLGWIYHKLIRRFLSVSDPYAYRKASWDILVSEIIQKRDNAWALKLLQNNPSLYPCLQCGSCTATCPVSDITQGDFNPRKIINNLLVGSRDKILIDKEPNVWDCTNCYSCDEICPQGVRLSETFNFLKNLFAERKEAPEGFLGEAENVYNFGVSIPLQSGIKKRREKLDLPSRPEFDIQEIQDMMDMTGFNLLVEKSNFTEKKEEISNGNS